MKRIYTKEETEEAERALYAYELLTDHHDRQRFLVNFEENGNGKGKDALKFASKFKKSLAFDDTTILAKVEDYYTPGEILIFNGSSLANFNKVADAIKMLSIWFRRTWKPMAGPWLTILP